jgi:hypothetical protein
MAAPPRGLTAEHLAFNLPQGETCSAVHYGKLSELLLATSGKEQLRSSQSV